MALNKKIVLPLILVIVAAGGAAGWLYQKGWFKDDGGGHSKVEHKVQLWTCSMHPQIRMEKPGKCPICAMDLIQLVQSGTSGMDTEAVHFTKESAQLANVLTTIVSTQNPVKELRLFGKIQADERLLQNQVAYIP